MWGRRNVGFGLRVTGENCGKWRGRRKGICAQNSQQLKDGFGLWLNNAKIELQKNGK